MNSYLSDPMSPDDVRADVQRMRDSGLGAFDTTSQWLPMNTLSVTAAYTVSGRDKVILADATSAPFTVTLPNATFRKNAQPITVKRMNAGGNNVTVASAGGNIDGVATQSITAQYGTISVVSDGTNWQQLTTAAASGGAAVGNGTYTLTNPLTGTNGVAATAPRSDMRPTVPSPTTPSTSAVGDTASSLAGTGFATDTHRHARESFATNAILLGAAAAAGAATTPMRSNDTIAAFDSTVPVTQNYSDAAATGSVAFAARRDHVHGMPAASGGPTFKYKSGTQVFTTNTTLADLTAAVGSFAFSVAANEVWLVECLVRITFGGTGGAQFTFTGPAAPTGVFVQAEVAVYDTGFSVGAVGYEPDAFATAFGTVFGSFASAASTAGQYRTAGGVGAFMRCKAVIINGANAGTVTLQGAQNNANSTTTFQTGSYMKAEKMA